MRIIIGPWRLKPQAIRKFAQKWHWKTHVDFTTWNSFHMMDSLHQGPINNTKLWYFLRSQPSWAIEQTAELAMTWDAMMHMWRHCKGSVRLCTYWNLRIRYNTEWPFVMKQNSITHINFLIIILNTHVITHRSFAPHAGKYQYLSLSKLPHSPSLVAIRLSVGYETWPPVGRCYWV